MHPVLFHVGDWAASSYGVLSIAAYAMAIAFGLARVMRLPIARSELVEGTFVAVACGVFGAKLFHVLFEANGHVLSNGTVAQTAWDLLRDDPAHVLRLFEAGYVYYGGALGGALGALVFVWRRGLQQHTGAIADAGLLALALGAAIGRVGCFLGGCCHGTATTSPWGVRFPLPHPSGGINVVPVQLVDAVCGLLLWGLGLVLLKRVRPGQTAWLVAVAYAALRFATEMWRGDQDRGTWWGLSTAQVTSLFVLLLAVSLWRRVWQQRPLPSTDHP